MASDSAPIHGHSFSETSPHAFGEPDGLKARLSLLSDLAEREYAASTESVWLAAITGTLRIGRCGAHDDVCATLVNGEFLLPWGCIKVLGSVMFDAETSFNLVAFSPLYHSPDEFERFLSFAATAGALAVRHPPKWMPSGTRPSDCTTNWVAALMFFVPPAAICVAQRDEGSRIIVQPWAASLAAMREWHSHTFSPTLAAARLPVTVTSPIQPPESVKHSKPPQGYPPADTATKAGFMGGQDLADQLGVHPTRREAFAKRLERIRSNLGDDAWHEVREPRPNSPKYLYNAGNPRLRELAISYFQAKPV